MVSAGWRHLIPGAYLLAILKLYNPMKLHNIFKTKALVIAGCIYCRMKEILSQLEEPLHFFASYASL